jgi:hypothetical protein
MPRWLKKTLLGAGITLGVLALVVVIARASFRRMGTKELDRVTARLDADDPGWRLDDVLAARANAAPPPERNPAEVARRVREAFTPEWQEFRGTRDFGRGFVHNELPGFWATAWFLQARPVTAEAREAARTQFLRPEIAAEPRGFVPLDVPDNPLMTLLPHTQKTREVFEILEVDAKLAALEGRPDRGITAARAGLVATRALGDEPFLISQLVRMAGASVAANSGLQVIAWGEPKDDKELAAFQAALRAEADHPYLLTGLRGERATFDRVFEGLENGTIDPVDLMGMAGGRKNPLVFPAFALYKGFLPADRAMSLKLYGEMIEAAKKPPHELKQAFQDIKYPFSDADRFRYIVTKLTLPAAQKVSEGAVRTRATLLTASAAVACERFRLARGKWPESLEEIPADILPPLPPDPYTGNPIRYMKNADGTAVVFTLADDLQVNSQFGAARDDDDPLRDIGRGWKLWPPAARGATRPAAEPPPAFDEPPGADGNP